MAATKGNQFWKKRTRHGRAKLFESPALLWASACEYFEYIEKTPLYESKAFAYQGTVTVKEVPRMRAMTLSGLCFFLGCSDGYFRTFKALKAESENQTDKDFLAVIEDIESVIFNQKFQGAAADLLNANIIARELGLVDKKDLTTDGEKIETVTIFQLPDNGRD